MNKQQAGKRTYEETIQTIQDMQKQQSLTYTQAVEERILQFKGATFSSPEDVEAWLRSFASSIRQSVIEEIEGKMPEEIQGATGDAVRFNYQAEYYQGFNDALSELHTLLEAMKKEAV